MSELPPSSPTCPRCSAPLAPTSAQGALCPRCMLAQGLAQSDPALDPESGPRQPPVPPEVAEIAPLFPELEIVELLGQGGMGAVYKARQRALGRWVALKILVPRPGDESGFAARFEREAHALARLAHPNVVGIHDSGRTQGRCWLLMEYVEGLNLRQLLRSGDLDVPRALAIVRQVCDALEFAHAEGIVHRDIKPENVLVDKKGRVKIADFGLAKIVGEAQPGDPITRTQQSMGTPQYMAPEQLTGSPNVDHRADIYSLGVVFYELLTGELPLGRFEPPSQRVHVDVRLDEVVLRALERAPERRYQHATEMKTGIERLDEPAPAPALPASASPPVSDPAWMFGLFAVPIAGVILELALGGLGIDGPLRRQCEFGYAALVLVLLCGAAWMLRKDRRGALLRCGLAAIGAAVALAGILRVRDLVALVGPSLALDPRPADAWIARMLLALAAFEALRIAWAARGTLRGRLVDERALTGVDLVLLAGCVYLGWTYSLVQSWDRLLESKLYLANAAFVLLLADWAACVRSANGPEPRAWLQRSRDAAPGPARPRRWLRGILLPALVALSAWIMSRYTSPWGIFGIVTSSLVLALAVAGYLQQSLPEGLIAELQRESQLLRALRAAAAIVVLSLGAISLGALTAGQSSQSAAAAKDPAPARVEHMAELVAANSRESIDPLHLLGARVPGSRLTSRAIIKDPAEASAAREPSAWDGVLLVLLAPAILLWTRRWGESWQGCWRYSAEVLLIVTAGLLGSLPARKLLPARAPVELAPLVLEASLPLGEDRVRINLSHELEADGYEVHRSATRIYGDAEGSVLLFETLRARRAVGPGNVLDVEIAGDSGQWGAAVRIDAGSVSADEREACREQLKTVLQRTRRH